MSKNIVSQFAPEGPGILQSGYVISWNGKIIFRKFEENKGLGRKYSEKNDFLYQKRKNEKMHFNQREFLTYFEK